MSASTRDDAPNDGSWLTVSQAAAALEISERTVRRRCTSGKLAARLVTLESGSAWEVSAAAVNAADTADIPADRLRSSSESENLSTAANAADAADSTPRAAAIAADGGLLAHLQSENAFLRGLVEQRDRDAAELRAALREALRAMPKQLEAREYSPAQKGVQSAPQAPQNSASDKVSVAAKSGAKTGYKREPRPLWKVILGMR